MYKPFTLQNRSPVLSLLFFKTTTAALSPPFDKPIPTPDSSHFRSMEAVRALGDGFWGETFISFRVIRSFAKKISFFCVTRATERERKSRKAFMWRAETLQFAKSTDQKEKVYRCSSFREVGESERFNFLRMDIFLVCLHKHEISMNLISVPFAFSMGNLFMRLSFMTAKDVLRVMPT